MIEDLVGDVVRYKIDLNIRCNIRQTAFHRTAWGDSAAVVELLQHRIDEMARDKDGNTALHIAAQMGFCVNCEASHQEKHDQHRGL